MNNSKTHSEAVKELAEKIKDIRIAMLTTAEEDGTLRSRPMATQKDEFDGTLWFFTADDSPKADEVGHNHNVNLSYADPGKNLYVSVSGTGQVVHDRQKAEELWSPFVKAWFPDGLEDPRLALLKVDVEQAEYWDSPNSKLVQIAGLAKALATGKPIEGGENEKVELK